MCARTAVATRPTSDCEALLEAHRCAGIHPVAVKSEDQQSLAALHRVRSQWLDSRTARINAMRGLLREFGIIAPTGSKRFMNELPGRLTETQARLPQRVRRIVASLWEEVRDLEQRIASIEEALDRVALDEPVVQALLRIPGILTATALFASVANITGVNSPAGSTSRHGNIRPDRGGDSAASANRGTPTCVGSSR